MNAMRNSLTFCLLLFCSAFFLKAQLTVGAKADLGLSWMPDAHLKTSGWEQRPWLGPQIGGYANYIIDRRFIAEAQINYNQMTARTRLLSQGTDIYGMPIGAPSYVNERKTLNALSFPIMAGYRFDWCDLMLGLQFNAILDARQRIWGLVPVHGQVPDQFIESSRFPIKHGDTGLKIGLVTRITQRFSIEAGYYHGLRNLSTQEWVPSSLKVRQVTYGLRYMIYRFNLRRYR